MYCYVTVVSLQYLTPLILTLNCTLLLKTLGENPPGRRRGRGLELERGGAEPGARGWSCSWVGEGRGGPEIERGGGGGWL